jgi:hypothetical protein
MWGVKYKRVYVRAYDSVSLARSDIADYINGTKQHIRIQKIDRIMPELKYINLLPSLAKATFYVAHGDL